MPWITINMLAGRSPEIKKQLHRKVTAAVVEALGVPAEWVNIQIVDMSDENHSAGGLLISELPHQ